MVADIPGLIEGAHTGAGLGTQFLRHIERTRLLVHLVDVSDSSGREDVTKDVEVIMGELASFGANLETKPMLMVASKIDVANKDKLAKLKRFCKKHKWKLYEISAVTGKGIEELKYAIAENVQELREQSGSEGGVGGELGSPALLSISSRSVLSPVCLCVHCGDCISRFESKNIFTTGSQRNTGELLQVSVPHRLSLSSPPNKPHIFFGNPTGISQRSNKDDRDEDV